VKIIIDIAPIVKIAIPSFLLDLHSRLLLPSLQFSYGSTEAKIAIRSFLTGVWVNRLQPFIGTGEKREIRMFIANRLYMV
jgi:hypothetical protein